MQFTFSIFVYAALLIIDGITIQILAGEKNPSILTPVFFGGIQILMGIMTIKKDLKLFGQHGSAALSLIAFVTSLQNFLGLFQNTSGMEYYINLANSIMAFFSILFLVLAVILFARERK
jgi:hypothetical protein